MRHMQSASYVTQNDRLWASGVEMVDPMIVDVPLICMFMLLYGVLCEHVHLLWIFLLYHHIHRQQNYVVHPGDYADRTCSLLTSEVEPPHFAYTGEFPVPIGQRELPRWTVLLLSGGPVDSNRAHASAL